MTVLGVALFGALGAVCRSVVDGVIAARTKVGFPWATFAINVSGSLLLGVLTAMTLEGDIAHTWLTLLGVGFCGGYTTFSTASFETVRLMQRRRFGLAVMYACGSVGVTIAVAALGFVLV
ncbi:fluoride efflux transporter CrcB [Rhodococcus rhodnii]|uniref:Fluoride-specific ion channel FluC n=1 Tax=Rhodococcus rhodnii TaxID=38312 RepID=A0A6P2CM77_9NOCA|nr:fluoride efflux transporter CrcB [Rhodococcus rhodnii]